MKTRAELVARALSNLGALPVGQTPSTQEYASVDALVTPMLESLSARDIFYVSDEAAIDDAAFIELGHCLAWASAPEFGMHQDAALAALKERAELDLLDMYREDNRHIHSRTMRSDYYPHSRIEGTFEDG
jgi:hypothetical protein